MTRARTKKPATFDPEAMNAALGIGAPWYTSGAHRWKGAAAILKPNPTMVMTNARISNGSRASPCPCTAAAILARLVDPDKPYNKLNPNKVNAAAIPPNKKYLMAASADSTFALLNPVST